MSDIKVRLAKDGPFEVNHKLAGIVPLAIPSEQEVLTENIKDNDQKEPIVLWQGKVVDGRCRQKALTQLNKNIVYRELDDELTEEEVQVYVKSVNTRRNLTSSQKVAVACREYTSSKHNTTQLKVAKSWGISVMILKNAIWLNELDHTIIDTIFDGGVVPVVDSKGNHKLSNKVTTIYAHYKRVKEATIEDNTYGWKADSNIITQAGKDWYYETIASIGDDIRTKQLLSELANYKFPV